MNQPINTCSTQSRRMHQS